MVLSRIDEALMQALSCLSDAQDLAERDEDDDGLVERINQAKEIIIEELENRRRQRERP